MEIRASVPYVRVADLDASLAFHRALGYEVDEELSDDHGVFWAALRNGASRLMLSNRPVHDAERLTWLYVDDVEAAYSEMIRAGVSPLGPPENQQHGTREFLVADASGILYVIATPIER